MLRPTKAIRKYCLWCMMGSAKEVHLCQSYTCPLHIFRLGKRCEPNPIISLIESLSDKLKLIDYSLTSVKAIRHRCLDCSVYSPKEVRNCKHLDCSIYPYRLGKNPNRKGIGGNMNLNSKISSTKVT